MSLSSGCAHIGPAVCQLLSPACPEVPDLLPLLGSRQRTLVADAGVLGGGRCVGSPFHQPRDVGAVDVVDRLMGQWVLLQPEVLVVDGLGVHVPEDLGAKVLGQTGRASSR